MGRGLVLAVAVVALLPVCVSAEAPRFKVNLELTEEYWENIYLTPDEAGTTPLVPGTKNNSDETYWVTRVEPTITIQLPGERAFADLSYKLSYLDIGGGEGDDEDLDNHIARFVARYNIDDTTSIGVEDIYQYAYSVDQTFDNTTGEVVDQDKDNFWMNTASLAFKKELGRAFGEIRYRNRAYRDKTESDYADFDEDAGELTLGYDLSPFTTIQLVSTYAERDFPNDDAERKDYSSWTEEVVLTQDLAKGLTATAHAGVSWRDYETGDDRDDFVGGVELRVQVSRRLDVRLNYDHRVVDTFIARGDYWAYTVPTGIDSVDRDYRAVRYNRYSINAMYYLTEEDQITLTWAYQDASASSVDWIGTAAKKSSEEDLVEYKVQYAHRFTDWMRVIVGAGYGERDSEVRGDYDYTRAYAGFTFIY